MPAVVKCVVYKSNANVTAGYENIKYYFQAPQDSAQDQDPTYTGSSHWGRAIRGLAAAAAPV